MNAREAMQALLDGRTLRASNGTLLRIRDGRLSICYHEGFGWHTVSVLNEVEDIVEECPLTFEEALRAMLDGKVVQNNSSKDYQFRFNGRFEIRDDLTFGEDEWVSTTIHDNEQEAKWRVVE